jgi:hypothetical protein
MKRRSASTGKSGESRSTKPKDALQTGSTAVEQLSDPMFAGGSLFPMEIGGFSALTSTADVVPGGQCTWYYWGPPGARVSVTVTRLRNSGGHLHPGGPTGTVSPTSFVLGNNYPQNVPVVFTAPVASATMRANSSVFYWESKHSFCL